MDMIITLPSPYENTKSLNIESYAEHSLDGCSYDTGQLEAAAATSRNNSRAIGRLLDLMASKGLLTAPEITQVVEGYENREASFTES